MLGFILTAILSFISTNIDDLFVLAFLYLQIKDKKDKLSILAGRYLGSGAILLISFLGAFGLSFVSEKYLGLLGFVPIALGIKELISYIQTKRNLKKDQEKTDEDDAPKQEPAPAKKTSLLLSTTVLAISNGADNIGVYVPLFTGFSNAEFIVFTITFILMTAFWCFFSAKLVSLPAVKEKLQRYKNILVPIVFIALGVYILLKNYL